MSKVRVYELAKEYGMKGPEMAELLRNLGFESIKSHMAVLDPADQMQVMARLEAQGLARTATAEAPDEAEPGVPRKKKLPRKKALPPPVEPVKKPLPAAPVESEAQPAAAAPTPPAAAEPPTAPANGGLPKEGPAKEGSTAERPAPSGLPKAPAKEAAATEGTPPPAAPPPAPTPPAAETGPLAPAPTAAELSEHVRPAPAAEAAAAAEEPTSAPRPERAAAETAAREVSAAGAEAGQQAAAEGGGEAPQVKRLLVPQAKAQVVGRIELPQETIRDATRRSAPASDRAGSRLRRMALQNTQGRAGRGRRGFAPPPRGRGRKSSTPMVTVDPNKVIEIQPPVSVKALSEAIGIKVTELITTLQFKLGVKGKTINSFLTADEVELVAIAVERNIKIVEKKEAEEELLQALDSEAADAEAAERPPIVTFMGHVDHGKTSLIDALRQSEITTGEAGGITQHVGAYRVSTEAGDIVILDTPGHAAFTAMRARGAQATDLVVLVVAADDGVMPQTEEAINHAKEAGVPIVVAINKCDKAEANPMQVMQQLAVKGLQSEEWGGTTQMAQVSATTGKGLDDLMEKIMLEAHILELRARPDAPGMGVVIESKQSAKEGVVLNVLVMEGAIKVKDQVLCGNSFARVRGMLDDRGNSIKEAGPATPVTLLGIDALPEPGEKIYVVTDQKKAREVVDERLRRSRAVSLAQRSSTAVTLDNLSEHLAARKAEEVKVIVKADVMGSLEPIKKCLLELNTDEVRVNIIHSALGGITDSDVSLAEASGALVIGFNTAPESTARQHAERAGVDIRLYNIIYDVIDEIRARMEGSLKPEEVEKNQGFAEVRAVFKSSRFGTIAGCYVREGFANRNSRVRLSRDGKLLYTGTIASLRREKDDVREVKAGFECGMTLKDWDDINEGDQLEFFEVTLVKRTLS